MEWSESGNLWVTTRPGHDGLAVRVAGDLDLFTAESLRRQACASIAFHRADVVELDLSECTFIDSAGVHVILQLRNALTRRGGRLDIAAASPQVSRVLGGALADRTEPSAQLG